MNGYEHFDEFIRLCREFGVKLNLSTNGNRAGQSLLERDPPSHS